MGGVLSVDDVVVVEVSQRLYYLVQVILHFHLRQPLPPLDQLVQSLVGADLQQDVDVFVVLEHVLELHDVLVVERLVDLDLSDQLLQGTTTFCLARDRLRELLAMILAAEIFLVSRLVTS